MPNGYVIILKEGLNAKIRLSQSPYKPSSQPHLDHLVGFFVDRIDLKTDCAPVPFDTLTAKQACAKSHAPENRKPRQHPLAQIADMQERLQKDVLSSETSVTARAQVARAWRDLESMKRIIMGLPANTSQSIREPKAPKSKKPVVQPLDNLPEA